MIEDVEAYRHLAYEYAFRFLRANILLSTKSPQDYATAIHQLEKIAGLAREHGDNVVFAFAASMEALVHLQGFSPESAESAQNALGSARSVQLDPAVVDNPQMQILMEFVDLCCTLQDMNPDQSSQKMKSMQRTMDSIVDNDDKWDDHGTLYIPLTRQSINGVTLTGGGLISEHNGSPMLMLTWLPKSDVYALGYLLSAVTVAHKNVVDGHKAEKFLEEGLRLIRDSISSPDSSSASLTATSARSAWRRVLECRCLLERAFLLCARSDWAAARSTVDEIDNLGNELGSSFPSELRCMARYLDGTIFQGTGDTTTALSIFRSPVLALSPNASRTSRNDPTRDIALLAALNTIFILHNPGPSNNQIQAIIDKIGPYITNHASPYIQAAFALVLSTLTSRHMADGTASGSSTLKTKQHLGNALSLARTIGNTHIVATTLNLMSDKFFKGVIGEQAEKSALAGQAVARKSGSALWTAVADGMLAETLERQGKGEVAERMWVEAERASERLPEGLRGKQANEIAG